MTRGCSSASLPAFLVLVEMLLTYSIADGMALGFIAYPIMQGLSGKTGEVHWVVLW